MIKHKFIHVSLIKILHLLLLVSFFVVILPLQAETDKFHEEMKIAEGLITESKLHQAEAVYVALLLKDPRYTPALLALGTIYTKEQKYSQAEGLFLKVINTSNDQANGYERLAFNYYCWAKSDMESYSFLMNKAKLSIDKAIIQDLYNYQIYLTQSLIYIEMQEYDKALDAIYKSLNIKSVNSDAYVNLGILYTALEKYDLALQNFQKAINLNSRNARAYNYLGKMLAKADQPRKAINNLKKSAFYDIFVTAEDHFLLGQLYEQVGDYNNAILEYYAALELKPRWTECLINIALIYERMGEDEKSIEAYQKAIAIDYSIMDKMVEQARDYLIADDLFRARNLFIKILKIEPGNRFGFEGIISTEYLLALKRNFDLTNWFHDESLLKKNLEKYARSNNLKNLNWIKFQIAKDGLTQQNSDLLATLSNSYPEVEDDYLAKSLSLFLQKKYIQSNESLTSTLSKVDGLYATNDNKKEYYNELLYLAESLFALHEYIKSKEIYDKLNSINGDKKAIAGLTVIANNIETSTSRLTGLIKVISSKNPSLTQDEITKNFDLIIALYPQNSASHYYYSEYLAKIKKYQQALDELLLFQDLKKLTKFQNMPTEKEIAKKLDSYRKLMDKQNK